MNRSLNIGTSLIIVFMLSACDGDDLSKRGVNEAPDLAGDWAISGSGEQSGCANQLDNFEYDFKFSERIPVETTLVGEEGEAQTWDLVSSNVSGLADFTGIAGPGDQVRFSFIDNSGGQSISYSFAGQIDSDSKLSGDYSAEGPGDCMTTNVGAKFKVVIY